MAEPPTGTVTFLFTDVEGSTRLWERHPEQMRAALAEHDALIEFLTEQHGGQVVRPRGEGDSRFCVFAKATDAVAAAAAIQQALDEAPWPAETPIRVRMAVHTGEADLRDGDYYGSAVNRAARLRGIAHGGQTLVSQATHDLVRDALSGGVALRDLGEHRLRDLGRSERVHQLVAPGAPAEFPPPPTLDSVPNNLPLPLTSFVGRDGEVANVARLLGADDTPGTARLLTLTGTGGTGKTRLALQAAAAVLPAFPDGAFVAELAPLADPALVPQAVAVVLGVREEPGRPLVETLTAALRPKRLLLVLDNCEHVLDASARLTDALLRGCPSLRVLATSREALGTAGETAWRVPSLALPTLDQHPTVDGLARCEAVRLFIERAQATLPDFALTADNALAVARICERLDGVPLAIELAAARLKGLGVEQLAARLDQRFRLLTGGSRTALPRQQTLRAAVDWSYDLLSAQERTLFERLAPFAGGFTLEAAETVCAGESIEHTEVLDLLLRLIDKSLVVAEPVGDGTDRYRLLETLRQYAREHLVATGRAEAQYDRHARYYEALADAWQPAGPTTTFIPMLPGQRAQFEREVDNLRGALRWYVETAAAEAGLRLAHSLDLQWRLSGRLSEAQRWLEALLATGGQTTIAARARACWGIGYYAQHQGDYDRACEAGERAVALGREAGDPRFLGGALSSVGLAHVLRGDAARGTTRIEEGLALRRAAGLGLDTVQPLRDLAHAARARGDLERARALLEESIAAAGNAPPWQLVWRSTACLGRVVFLQGQHEEARERLRWCLERVQQLNVAFQAPDALEWYAAVLAAAGRPLCAARLFGAAHALRAETGQVRFPLERASYAADLQVARAGIPADTFAVAWAEGAAMTLEQAIAYALQEDGGGERDAA